MTDSLHDLFPGFNSERVPTEWGDIFARIGGSGSPLLLIHGYPQSHAMWHKIAPSLAERHTVVVVDLPGYGRSDIFHPGTAHVGYSKRRWAEALISVMARQGFERFSVAGHDRGGRVAYRMALDAPERLARVAVLDILPTYEYWAALDREFSLKIHHWMFLAQPKPVPEKLIGHDTDGHFGPVFDATRADGSAIFNPYAVRDYVAQMRDQARLSASCDDYRAGAAIDVEHDAADLAAGRKIEVPLLALWGKSGVAVQAAPDQLAIWRRWAHDVEGHQVPGGHFICEESPARVAEALTAFFATAIA